MAFMLLYMTNLCSYFCRQMQYNEVLNKTRAVKLVLKIFQTHNCRIFGLLQTQKTETKALNLSEAHSKCLFMVVINISHVGFTATNHHSHLSCMLFGDIFSLFNVHMYICDMRLCQIIVFRWTI